MEGEGPSLEPLVLVPSPMTSEYSRIQAAIGLKLLYSVKEGDRTQTPLQLSTEKRADTAPRSTAPCKERPGEIDDQDNSELMTGASAT